MSSYITIKCPRCMSASELKTTSTIHGPFLCPVCTEGEIEVSTERCYFNQYRRKILFHWDSLVTLYSATR